MVRFDKGVLKLQVILRKHFIDNGRVAFYTDIWTDNATQMMYNVNTLHMIDDNWVMHARVMSCDEFSEARATSRQRFITTLLIMYALSYPGRRMR
jgi:hypothetical protein